MNEQRLLPPGDPHDGFFLWGAPKAGKSAFMGALYGLSRTDDGAVRWTAHPKDCDDPYTQEVLLRAYEELKERRNTKTGVRNEPYRPLRLKLRKVNGARQVGELQVAVVDPAGEYSTDPAHRLSFAGKAIYRQIATSHGLLWLFEATPDGEPSALDRLLILEQLVSLLEAGDREQLDLPVALCLSKIDCLSPERREAARENPTTALLEHLGHTTLTWFEAVCPTLECFAISSAGTVPNKVRPVGLNDVLDWFEEQRARRSRDMNVRVWRGKLASMVRSAVKHAGRGALFTLLAGAAAVAGTTAWNARGVARGASDTATGSSAASDTALPVRGRQAGGDVSRLPTRAAVPNDPRAERDSMRTVFREALDRHDAGEPSRAMFRRAYGFATRLIDRGPAGSRGLVPLRFVRARSCVLGQLSCDAREVREDLTWVLASGSAVERREAVRMLASVNGDDTRVRP